MGGPGARLSQRDARAAAEAPPAASRLIPTGITNPFGEQRSLHVRSQGVRGYAVWLGLGWKGGMLGRRRLCLLRQLRLPFLLPSRALGEPLTYGFTSVAVEFPIGNGRNAQGTVQRETQKQAQKQGLEIMILLPRCVCCLLSSVVRLLSSSLLSGCLSRGQQFQQPHSPFQALLHPTGHVRADGKHL